MYIYKRPCICIHHRPFKLSSYSNSHWSSVIWSYVYSNMSYTSDILEYIRIQLYSNSVTMTYTVVFIAHSMTYILRIHTCSGNNSFTMNCISTTVDSMHTSALYNLEAVLLFE